MDEELPPIPATTILDELGERIAGVTFDQLEETGLRLIQVALVDTLGVAIAGADFEGVAIAYRAAVGPKRDGALILGTSQRTSALDAGFLNGIAAHALDYDDGNAIQGGHPSVALVPAILALGEELNASARDLIVGYAAGYEAIIRLSRGLNPTHYEKGWHPTSTIGVFGVAAASARMLGLNGKSTTVALAIAASMAAGVKANFGTMTKALHVGHAVRSGILCAKLAAAGYSASRAALDAQQGFLNVYNGADHASPDAILGRLDRSPEVNRAINAIKAYPCCASTHSAISAALAIRREHGVRPEEVDDILIVVDPNRMPHTNRPKLDEALSGKFSLQYVVARALKDGAVGLEHFDGDAHLDPVVLDLMARCRVEASPADWPINSFAAEVAVRNQAGVVHKAFFDRAPRSRAGMTEVPDGLWEKFTDCAGRTLKPAGVAALVRQLRAFPEFGDVRSLMRLAAAPRERTLERETA